MFKEENEHEKLIVCNGFKPDDYLGAIIEASKDYNVIDIIDGTLTLKGLKILWEKNH